TVAKGGGVVDGVHQDGLEQDLGHDLTGGGNAQGAGGDVLGDAALLAHSGGLHLPVGAGELTVLVVTQSTQDHGQSLIPGDGVIGAESTGVVALDVLGVGAEVDVAGVPRGRRDVVELVVVGIDADLGVSHIAGDDAVD